MKQVTVTVVRIRAQYVVPVNIRERYVVRRWADACSGPAGAEELGSSNLTVPVFFSNFLIFPKYGKPREGQGPKDKGQRTQGQRERTRIAGRRRNRTSDVSRRYFKKHKAQGPKSKDQGLRTRTKDMH